MRTVQIEFCALCLFACSQNTISVAHESVEQLAPALQFINSATKKWTMCDSFPVYVMEIAVKTLIFLNVYLSDSRLQR
jgi:Fe-S-cluster-containing hydrogenase component 2